MKVLLHDTMNCLEKYLFNATILLLLNSNHFIPRVEGVAIFETLRLKCEVAIHLIDSV